MPSHVFFDLDKTLTPSRSRILPAHAPLLERLCEMRDVIVVTGGGEGQIIRQLEGVPREGYYMLSQQGNLAKDKRGALLWQESVTPAQEQAARDAAEIFKADLALPVRDENDLFENRGSQLNYSTIGFHESEEKKRAYDPDFSKRFALIARHPEALERLRQAGLEAIPAGSTTIDFILAGKDKGYNIARFIERMGWNKEDCLYVGDALFPGGNDERVIGVIPTQAVEDQNETFRFIEENLLS